MGSVTDARGDEPDLIAVMRHAEHEKGVLTPRGEKEAADIGDALGSYLFRAGGFKRVELFFTSEPRPPDDSPSSPAGGETYATANVVAARLRAATTEIAVDEPQHLPLADGDAGRVVPAGPHSPKIDAEGSVADAVKSLRRPAECDGGRVVVLVCNDPYASWVCAKLAGPVPLRRGEMAVFEQRDATRSNGLLADLIRQLQDAARGGPRWVLAWPLFHRDGMALAQLRGKIQSKMDVAKVFGAVGVGLLAFLAQESAKGGAVAEAPLTPLALLLVGVGTLLYFATLFSYDRLLMPKTFWTSKRPGPTPRWVSSRPPAADRWIVYQNMVHIWRYLFTPACVFIGLGLVVLAANAFEGRSDRWVAGWGAGTVVTLIVTGLWWVWNRPRLGTED